MNIMKKTENGEKLYNSPSVQAEELYVEGVLCASSKEASTEEWDVVDLSNL